MFLRAEMSLLAGRVFEVPDLNDVCSYQRSIERRLFKRYDTSGTLNELNIPNGETTRIGCVIRSRSNLVNIEKC